MEKPKQFTLTLTEEERNLLLECIRATEIQTKNSKLNSAFHDVYEVLEKKQKSIFDLWGKIEHTMPQK